MKKTSLLLLLVSGLGMAYTPVPELTQPDLGYRTAPLLQIGGYQFKDLNKNGSLDPYEDWRLPVDQRITNLISQMTFCLLYTSDAADE